jgi:hypothetical protein
MEYSNEPQPMTQTPYIALMIGRDKDDQFLLSSLFISLNETLKEILVGEGTLSRIQGWVTSGLLPQTHALAISKLIGMLALEDEIATSAVPKILEKIGIAQPVATQLADEILALVQPFIEQRVPESESVANPVRPIAPTPPSSSAPSRNTIDLRNKPTV